MNVTDQQNMHEKRLKKDSATKEQLKIRCVQKDGDKKNGKKKKHASSIDYEALSNTFIIM